MAHAIDHCDLYAEIARKMTADDFKEEVMSRTAQLVTDAQTGNGKVSKPHKLAGVELVARSVAQSVIDAGARQIAEDLRVDIGELKELAASTHISSC